MELGSICVIKSEASRSSRVSVEFRSIVFRDRGFREMKKCVDE